MATNAFIGSSSQPGNSDLSRELGKRKVLWDEVLAELEKLGAGDCQWHSYSVKSGWILKVLRKKRAIVYLGPMHGGFRASFILGDKAFATAKVCAFTAKIQKLISEGTRYPEGTAVRIEVTSRSDVSAVAKLAKIKLAN
jgi:hypothetical protein